MTVCQSHRASEPHVSRTLQPKTALQARAPSCRRSAEARSTGTSSSARCRNSRPWQCMAPPRRVRRAASPRSTGGQSEGQPCVQTRGVARSREREGERVDVATAPKAQHVHTHPCVRAGPRAVGACASLRAWNAPASPRPAARARPAPPRLPPPPAPPVQAQPRGAAPRRQPARSAWRRRAQTAPCAARCAAR